MQIDTRQDELVRQFFEHADKAEVIAVDTEGNKYLDKDKTLTRDPSYFTIGISIAFLYHGTSSPISSYFPFAHQHGNNWSVSHLPAIKELIESKTIVMHNAKHDIPALESVGIKVNRFYDTLIMAHFVNENWKIKKLDHLGKLILKSGKEKSERFTRFEKNGLWEYITPELMADYAAHDAEITIGLFDYFRSIMKSEDTWKLWDVEEQYIRLMMRIENNGVRLDQTYCDIMLQEGLQRMGELREEIGLNPASRNDLEELLINKLGLPVVKTTDAGKPSFDKFAMKVYDEILENRPGLGTLAKLIKEFRGYQKTTSACYKSYLNFVDPDGRLRPNFKLHVARTSRLSCESPALHQIPVLDDTGAKPWNGGVRYAFIGEEGYELYTADESQLEFRVAAAYGGDQNLIDLLESELDLFIEMSKLTGLGRSPTKNMSYATLYGAGLKHISAVFGVSTDDARVLYNRFFRPYPGLYRKILQASKKAEDLGYINLWTGRRRHFVSSKDSHKAFNSVMQGGAAEIVKYRQLAIDREIGQNEDFKQILQVHDEVVCEVRKGKEKEYLPELKRIMENVQEDYPWKIKFKAKVSRWVDK